MPSQSRSPAIWRYAFVGLRPLPAAALLDHFLDLALHRVQVECRRRLHGWEFDRSLRQLGDSALHLDKPPEFAGVEVVQIAASEIVQRLPTERWRSLERILA